MLGIELGLRLGLIRRLGLRLGLRDMDLLPLCLVCPEQRKMSVLAMEEALDRWERKSKVIFP